MKLLEKKISDHRVDQGVQTLLFRSEMLGFLKLGPLPLLKEGVREGEIDLERICSLQAHQLPRPTSPPRPRLEGFGLRGAGLSPPGRRRFAQFHPQPRRTP